MKLEEEDDNECVDAYLEDEVFDGDGANDGAAAAAVKLEEAGEDADEEIEDDVEDAVVVVVTPSPAPAEDMMAPLAVTMENAHPGLLPLAASCTTSEAPPPTVDSHGEVTHAPSSASGRAPDARDPPPATDDPDANEEEPTPSPTSVGGDGGGGDGGGGDGCGGGGDGGGGDGCGGDGGRHASVLSPPRVHHLDAMRPFSHRHASILSPPRVFRTSPSKRRRTSHFGAVSRDFVDEEIRAFKRRKEMPPEATKAEQPQCLEDSPGASPTRGGHGGRAGRGASPSRGGRGMYVTGISGCLVPWLGIAR